MSIKSRLVALEGGNRNMEDLSGLASLKAKLQAFLDHEPRGLERSDEAPEDPTKWEDFFAGGWRAYVDG